MKEMMQAIASGKSVIVKLSQVNCAPCVAIQKPFGVLAEQHEQEAEFFAYDVSELPVQFLKARGVRSVPTVLFFRHGIEVSRLNAAEVSPSSLEREITKFLDVMTEEEEEYVCESCQ